MTTLYYGFILLFLVLFSCCKKEQDKNIEKASALTSVECWTLTRSERYSGNMNTWQDSDLLPCQTDDCLRFFNDGTYFSHTNGTPCNFLIPSQFTGEWHFTNNQTSMVIATPHFGTGTIGIIELSPSRFITQETLLTIPYLVMNRNTHEPR